MSRVIRVHRHGGPDVLVLEAENVGAPSAGEVRVVQSAIGVNFIDVYHRSGLYPQSPPFTPGVEGAGVIDAVGAGVSGFSIGDRVAYANVLGSYREVRLIKAERVIKLPDSISDAEAAALIMRGLTAEYLLHRTYRVKAGDWVLFHAAAGGVGSISVPWLKGLGATVIATAGSAEKCAIAESLGADHAVNYREAHWVARVKELTDGAGVHVVYDGVGRDTCIPSLDLLRPRGCMVTFGNASGPVPGIEPLTLSAKGSLFLTRPTLAHYIATRSELEQAAETLFEAVRQGHVKPSIRHMYAFADAAQAHRDLESRRTTGSIILTA